MIYTYGCKIMVSLTLCGFFLDHPVEWDNVLITY